MKSTKKITVHSPANIAFMKYWGQKDAAHILPYTDSFSMNLSECYTITTVQLESGQPQSTPQRQFYLKKYDEKDFEQQEGPVADKVSTYVDKICHHLKTSLPQSYTIYSTNSFPIGTGIASSASFFSSLAMAVSRALGATLSTRELSILARLSGSGSACRSLPDGFVWWHKGKSTTKSCAESIGSEKFWDLADIVLIFNDQHKRTGSQEGHKKAESSPFFTARVASTTANLPLIKKAFLDKDFAQFGQLIEADALSMHAVMMTQTPPLFYWSPATIRTIHWMTQLRETGQLESYFTIDAGENIHMILKATDVPAAIALLQKDTIISQPSQLIVNYPAKGAHTISRHLF